MLFRPPPDQSPAAVQALLDAWNVEADDFRRIARAARVTGQAMSSTVLAAEDISEELVSILEELDEALGKASSGTKLFTDLLHAQVKATALLESIAKTLDILDACMKVGVNGPTIIGRATLDADLPSMAVKDAA
jgi:nitrogen fixation/metabolism regulation signal transduction histidine kinase